MAEGIPVPDSGPVFPQEVAEESSVRPANDAIRDLLRQQSGRPAVEGDRRGTAVELPIEDSTPRKRTTRKADEK